VRWQRVRGTDGSVGECGQQISGCQHGGHRAEEGEGRTQRRTCCTHWKGETCKAVLSPGWDKEGIYFLLFEVQTKNKSASKSEVQPYVGAGKGIWGEVAWVWGGGRSLGQGAVPGVRTDRFFGKEKHLGSQVGSPRHGACDMGLKGFCRGGRER